MIRWAVRPFLDKGCAPIVIAAPGDHLDLARDLFASIPAVAVVEGGATRSASVAAALQDVTTDKVLVHDAARPFVSHAVIERVLDALERADAVVPAVEVAETLKRVDGRSVTATVDRAGLWSVQTPQGFRTDLLRRAHAEGGDADATDDAALVERVGGGVEVVRGERRNVKITTEEDVEVAADLAARSAAFGMRIGHGFDVHAFAEGRRLVIGGVNVPHARGLTGHSDADVLSHALADAILGAARLGDLGKMFPPDDRWSGASSLEIVETASRAVRERGWSVANVDATLVAQEPKLAPFTDEMEARLAGAVGVSPETISVKATTTDGLGSTGRGEGIAAHAVVLLRRLG